MFSLKQYLTTHIREVHQKIKPFKCSICGSDWQSNSIMISHIKAVHDVLKPFKCSFCDHTFSNKSNMAVHIRAIHNEQSFKCPLCGYNFKSLEKHISSVHDGIKPFKCDICQNRFARTQYFSP